VDADHESDEEHEEESDAVRDHVGVSAENVELGVGGRFEAHRAVPGQDGPAGKIAAAVALQGRGNRGNRSAGQREGRPDARVGLVALAAVAQRPRARGHAMEDSVGLGRRRDAWIPDSEGEEFPAHGLDVLGGVEAQFIGGPGAVTVSVEGAEERGAWPPLRIVERLSDQVAGDRSTVVALDPLVGRHEVVGNEARSPVGLAPRGAGRGSAPRT
jgi:hypothetical protein